MRRRVFQYVGRLVKLRTTHPALAVNDTQFIHVDFNDSKRVMVWTRGGPAQDPVVVIAKRLRGLSRAGRERMGDLTGVLSETIRGRRVVQAYRAEGYEAGRFRDVNDLKAARTYEPLHGRDDFQQLVRDIEARVEAVGQAHGTDQHIE